MLGIEPLSLKNGTLLGTECTTHKQYRGKLTAGLYGAAIGSFGSLCFAYCSFCYGKILYLIYKQSKKEKTRRENSIILRAKVHKAQQNASYRRRKTHYKVTISLIVATGVSLFGFILYSIGAAFGGASDSALKRAIITGVLKRGCFINNACNPVIYFICDKKFRHAWKKLYMK
ncbi:unnamed protein product [Mytilus coruscus]|uniref:G-protein coupled receptors family 1 profile domain-containing protein n=1 Tax=Mytilus coruscus TaxID=42192 RepID=A0A6J8DWG5_MYTCO|nr:unnamed protein product [Mytilus coruscus]